EPLQKLDRILVGHDLLQSFNWEWFNRSALSQGELPLWNPYMFSGFPGLADIQTELLYPPAIALRWLPIPAFFTILSAGHMLIAGVGTYALCRFFSVSPMPSLVGAIGFMLGGVFAPRIDAGHVTVIAVWAWFPAALWLAIHVTRSASWSLMAGLSLVLAAQILAGHPQSTLYAFGATVLCFFIASVRALRRSGPLPASSCLLRGMLAFLLAFGLSAVQVLPSSVLIGELGRSEGITFEAAARNSLGPEHVLTFLFPNAFPSLPPDPADSFQGKYWEQSSYVGLVATLLAPLALFHRRERWMIGYFGLLAIIGVGFAAGKNLPFFHLHYLLLPGLRQASRILPLWSMAVAVLGSIGLDQLIRMPAARQSKSIYVLLISGVTVALATLPLLPDVSIRPGEAYGRSIAFVLVPLALVLLLTFLRGPGRLSTGLTAALVVCVAVDLVTFATGFIHVVAPPDRRSDRQSIGQMMDGVDVGRVVSLCDNDLPPNDLTFLKLPTIDGYNSSYLADYARYGLLVSNGADQALTIHPPRFWPAPNAPSRPDLLRLLNVTHVIGCTTPPPDGYQTVREQRRVFVFSDPARLDRAIWMCRARTVGSREEAIEALTSLNLDTRSTVVIEGDSTPLLDEQACGAQPHVQVTSRDRADGWLRAHVSTPSGGVLFMSEPHYPERRAWLDGQEVPALRADLAFTAVAVGPGDHEVELRLIPTSLYIGAVVSGMTLVILLAGFFWSRTR
ncbi:MAG TPA: hypothetical protein VHX16_20190, partial [Chloroflexota bacterium]|nr:hypothetical protein [Chloroflexota bacterium]